MNIYNEKRNKQNGTEIEFFVFVVLSHFFPSWSCRKEKSNSFNEKKRNNKLLSHTNSRRDRKGTSLQKKRSETFFFEMEHESRTANVSLSLSRAVLIVFTLLHHFNVLLYGFLVCFHMYFRKQRGSPSFLRFFAHSTARYVFHVARWLLAQRNVLVVISFSLKPSRISPTQLNDPFDFFGSQTATVPSNMRTAHFRYTRGIDDVAAVGASEEKATDDKNRKMQWARANKGKKKIFRGAEGEREVEKPKDLKQTWQHNQPTHTQVRNDAITRTQTHTHKQT